MRQKLKIGAALQWCHKIQR